MNTRALGRVAILTLLVALLPAVPSMANGVGPGFSLAFTPHTIGPGSSSQAVFTIDNSGGSEGLEELAFSMTWPAGTTTQDPTGATTTCGGTTTAVGGGGTVSLADGVLAPGGTCTVSFFVEATMTGVATSTTLTYNEGVDSVGPASATLTVDTGRPGFSKSFSPASAPFGDRSELVFTIDNTANDGSVNSLSFTDELPAGMVVASPSGAVVNGCDSGTSAGLVAQPGSSTVTFGEVEEEVVDEEGGEPAAPGGAAVAVIPEEVALEAGAVCTIQVDVVTTGPGTFDNVTGDLFAGINVEETVSSGFAADPFEATAGDLFLTAEFIDDPVLPGGHVTLRYRIGNRARSDAASAIAFTHDLEGTLTGLTSGSPVPVDPCGSGSAVSVSPEGELTLTGGSLAAGMECVFEVVLTVPDAAVAEDYPSTTSTVTGTIDGAGVVGNAASDVLTVAVAPVLTMAFTDDPIGAGGQAHVEFTVSNPSSDLPMSDVAFDLPVDPFVVESSTPPADGQCGVGSVATFTPRTSFALSGGSLEASETCVVGLDVVVDTGSASGTYPHTAGPVTATLDGSPVQGGTAPDDLEVVGAPRLVKSFAASPVVPDSLVDLVYTLTFEGDAAATDIAFTDDLTALMPADAGLTATAAVTECGGAVDIADPTLIAMSGGTLQPGETCTITVTIDVPGTATEGLTTSTSSALTATVGGVATVGTGASADLLISGLAFSKTFDDPVIAGDTVTLTYDLVNAGQTDVTDIAFTDDFDDALAGLVSSSGTFSACGDDGAFSGTDTGTFTGGALTAGSQCSIVVELVVPAGADDGAYDSSTSDLVADFGGGPVDLLPAADSLDVNSALIGLEKAFTDDPVEPGGTVTLEFTITNLSDTTTIDHVQFSDDLDAVLTGLGNPIWQSATCTGSNSSTGTEINVRIFNLGPSADCVLVYTVSVPTTPLAAPPPYVNVTSAATGEVGDLAVTGAPATDVLEIVNLTLTKAFDGPTVAGGTADLTFTITNPLDDLADGLAFTDDLDAMLSGATVVEPLPDTSACGDSSSLAGSSTLTFNGGSLRADESCEFTVTVNVPAAAAPDTYPNVTSALTQNANPVTEPATADLVVEPPPTFSKAFDANPVERLTTVGLTFTIDNSASTLDATGLAFTDSLPSGMTVAADPGVTGSCDGTVTAPAGGSTIELTGGTVPAGASCTITVHVVASVDGDLVNTTGDLTSSSGNSGTASDTLTVTGSVTLGFAKVFEPDAVRVDTATTLTFTIDNSGSHADATSVAFSDNFPDGLEVAGSPDTSNTCGGTFEPVAGDVSVALTGGEVPAGSTCVLSVSVVPTIVGSMHNITSALESSHGVGVPAEADLVSTPRPTSTPDADLAVELTPGDQRVEPGEQATTTVEVTNNGPDTVAATLTVTGPGASVDGSLSCTTGTDEVVCDLGALAPDGSTSVDVTTTHPDEGDDTIEATVEGAGDDPDPDNNTASATITVETDAGSMDLTQFSVEEAQLRFPSSTFAQSGFAQAGPTAATWAVIGRDDVFADSLAGTVLTGTAPLLYTPPAILDERIVDELARLLGDSGTVYLLGGEAALSPDIDAALTDLGYDPVLLDGPTRVETALAVADEALRLAAAGDLPEWDGLVGVARADSPADNPTAAWADSVTAGAWTAAEGVPLLLTPTDSLHQRVAEWLLDNDVSRAVVLGGEAAIAADTMTALRAVVPDVQRVAGSERAGTAVAVAETLRGVGPDGTRGYVIVGGYADTGWAHGLLAGGRAADIGTAILLVGVDQVPPATLAAVTSCADEPVTVERLGETEQVSDAVMAELDAADDQPC